VGNPILGSAHIRRIVVVIPARDEESTIGAALDAVDRAARSADGINVDVAVVANGCADRTAELARAHGARVLTRSTPNVGGARADGAAWALSDGPDGLWLACTDADSVVPADWLVEHVRAAEVGFDVFLGTVTLTDDDAYRHESWASAYALTATVNDTHGHVHGANLGVRATTYVRVGGFHDLVAHEDANLVGRLRAMGAAITWASHVPVLTSARHDPRAMNGVGTDLAASR